MKFFIAFAFLLVTINVFSQSKNSKATIANEMGWWYEKPATKYWEGVPVGTGRFATMVTGKVAHEDFVFNDETLWSGGPYNPNNPNGPKILDSVRKFVLAKDYVSATSTALRLNSTPMSVQHYQPMGILNISFDNHNEKEVTNYMRKLSMDSAVATVTYRLNGVDYKREVFASYPDQVIVMRISASRPGSINLKSWLSSLQPSAETYVKNDDVIMHGTTTELSTGRYVGTVIPAKMKWQARLKVMSDGGTISYAKEEGRTGDLVNVNNANTVTILLAGATNWKSWNDVSGNEKERCDEIIDKVKKFSYVQLRARHLADYIPLFATCKIDLGYNEAGKLNTTSRMQKLRAGGEDPLYIAQYFQFGRYLLLAAAREGTLAFNNHNIWLNNMEGRWQGRWTLNINIQECYWPVENTSLQRLNEPLVRFTELLAEAGKRTARELYGCKGWTAHHGTDIWFNTAPTDRNAKATVWPMGGAWLLQQLYDHYVYEPDEKYLKRIYPLMKGAVEFFLDFMITDPSTGWLVNCPSTTPENNFYTDKGEIATVTMGTSMDNQILRNLFRNYIQATETLNKDEGLRLKVKDAIKKLPQHQVGKFGQLQEWLYDFNEVEPGHRHISHLFAAFPDDDITIRKTPVLADAAKVVLKRRGDINKGWSGAWKINQHARLEEPEEAYSILKSMLTDISIHPREEDSDITPSFEGNQGIQGVTSGIVEMLMQSHSKEISLLPALPKAWTVGSITGLRGKGAYNIDVYWKNNKLSSATLTSKINQTCRLRTKTPVYIRLNGKVVTTKKVNGLYVFNVLAGERYIIIGK